MTTSLREIYLSLYLPLISKFSRNRKALSWTSICWSRRIQWNRSKISNQLNQNYGCVHPWLPAPATLFPPQVTEHTERDHELQSLGEKRGREKTGYLKEQRKKGGWNGLWKHWVNSYPLLAVRRRKYNQESSRSLFDVDQERVNGTFHQERNIEKNFWKSKTRIKTSIPKRQRKQVLIPVAELFLIKTAVPACVDLSAPEFRSQSEMGGLN